MTASRPHGRRRARAFSRTRWPRSRRAPRPPGPLPGTWFAPAGPSGRNPRKTPFAPLARLRADPAFGQAPGRGVHPELARGENPAAGLDRLRQRDPRRGHFVGVHYVSLHGVFLLAVMDEVMQGSVTKIAERPCAKYGV